MSKKAQSLENLQLAIHGVTAPFACEGTFVPENPVTFLFKDHLPLFTLFSMVMLHVCLSHHLPAEAVYIE